MADKKKVKKILSKIGTVLLYLFMALCLAAVLMTIFSKRSEDGAVNLFGYEMRVVLSGSMEKNDETDVSGYKIKSIPVKSLVVTEKVPEDDEKANEWYGKLEVGDVLTFRYLTTSQETITHRITAIEKLTYGYMITLHGDNVTQDETGQVIYTDDRMNPQPANYVLGKVVHVSAALGKIVYIMQQPVGIALVVMVPAAIIIILQVVRIVSVLGEEKRKKIEARETEKSNEIELLKKRLADLEQQKDTEKPSSETKSVAPMPEEELPKTQEGGTMSEDAPTLEEDVQIDETASEDDIREENAPADAEVAADEGADAEIPDTETPEEAVPDEAQSISESDGDPPADEFQKEE